MITDYQALIRIYGCENLEEFKEYTGYTFPGLVHPDDLEITEQNISRQIFTCSRDLDYVEYRIIRKDGAVHEMYSRYTLEIRPSSRSRTSESVPDWHKSDVLPRRRGK